MWHGKVLAQSDRFEVVENSVCFPPGTLDRRYFKDSPTTSLCPWKGMARYFTTAVGGAENRHAAWYYSDPKPAASQIKGFVALRRGFEVQG